MPPRTSPRRRFALPAIVTALILAAATAHADEGRLPSSSLQKAAVACQKLVEQIGAQVQAGKLAALDACANAALACVQTKSSDGGCLAKAGQTCAKKLGKASAALAKAKSKIIGAKSCSTDLRGADLMSADGLGYGRIVGSCQVDFGLEVCGGIEPLAECLIRARDRAAGAQYGDARPRTAELLDLLPATLPVVSGLPEITGCNGCSVAAGNGKAVQRCGVALTKATRALGASLEKIFASCAQNVLACVQTKGAEACTGTAAASCDQKTTKIDAAVAKLAAAVEKKCGAAAVDFTALADVTGLNLAALGSTCSSPPTSAGTLATCLQGRTECSTAAQVRHAFGRLDDLASANRLGALGSRLTASCPAVAPTPKSRSAVGRTFFGSMTKFIKAIRRPNAGVAGTLTPGARPPTTPGIGRTVLSLGAPNRVAFGAINKIPFRYKIGGPRSAAASARLAADPPKLIVTVKREDVVLEDHFEIELDPPPAVETEINDEIEISYQDSIPGCAFSLAFATAVEGAVSDDTAVLQAVDVPPPPPAGGPITQIISVLGDGHGHQLTGLVDVAVDGSGTVYASGSASNNVLKVTPSGTVTQIIDATGDGTGHGLASATGVAVDGDGNVYVVGSVSDNAFRITPDGTITQIIDASGDGTHALATPEDVAVTSAGTAYVTGRGSSNVFEITAAGTITRIADSSGDGAGHFLAAPYGVAVGGTGTVYTNGIFRAFAIATGGGVTQIIGSDGDGAGHEFGGQGRIAVDDLGNVYATSSLAGRLFKATPDGTVTLLVDTTGDGTHPLQFPYGGVAVDAARNVYVTGATSNNAFRVTPGGAITQILDVTGDGKGHLAAAPSGIAVDGDGNVYVGTGSGVFKIARTDRAAGLRRAISIAGGDRSASPMSSSSRRRRFFERGRLSS